MGGSSSRVAEEEHAVVVTDYKSSSSPPLGLNCGSPGTGAAGASYASSSHGNAGSSDRGEGSRQGSTQCSASPSHAVLSPGMLASVASHPASDHNAKTVGLENYGNSCYCNSVIQLLYSCRALRARLLHLMDDKMLDTGEKGFDDTVLYKFAELVSSIHKSSSKEKKNKHKILGPSHFVQKIKKENAMFRNAQQQDAQEFTMFVINCLIENERELLLARRGNDVATTKKHTAASFAVAAAAGSSSTSSSVADGSPPSAQPSGSANDVFWSSVTAGVSSPRLGSGSAATLAAGCSDDGAQKQAALITPIKAIFEGTFASETSCMECETKTIRYEPFLDLSIDIEQNASLTRCIDTFSAPEFLIGADKFRCDACCASSPARRCLRLHCAPQDALLIHLKRFKYFEEQQAFKKLAWHVALPNELALHTATESRALFTLKGFVLHQGSGPNLGHYISCIRTKEPTVWRRFDDDIVTELSERDVQQFFGMPFHSDSASTSTAYILLYERTPC